MKKLKFLLFCLCALIIFTGCNNDDKFEEYENRIELLESRIDMIEDLETVVNTIEETKEESMVVDNTTDIGKVTSASAAENTQQPQEAVRVVISDGSTVDEIITILTDSGISTREELIFAINEYDFGFDFLNNINELDGRYYRLEGYLCPDIYEFYTDSSAETVIYKMLDNFNAKLGFISSSKPYQERLAELGLTLDEVIILASMIESEVKFPNDYENVSSVLHNRLFRPLDNITNLGCDSTAVYAYSMEVGEKVEQITHDIISYESPYNTRLASGLPPGAICNPSYLALYSAFYPSDTDYYYFVSDKDGHKLYASTEAQHYENIEQVIFE